MNKRKWIAAGVFVFLVAIFLFFNWQYPYSFISVKKSIEFTPDIKMAEGVTMDLQSLHHFYAKNPAESEDLTANRTEYILDIFDEEGLSSKKTVKMDDRQMTDYLTFNQRARTLLLELAFREKYTKETKEYLKMAVENNIEIETALLKVKNDPTITRGRAESYLHEAYMMMQNQVDYYQSFYESYIRAGKN
ncbi:hypothetical protein [Falsibacillus pallidus]|uniref:hypothetical protein n=1 Tax=Falsibacillus pallidus TaxID=493781 RepID=UPI003D97DF1D